MSHATTTRLATLRWPLLALCLVLAAGCGSSTFYPVRYHPPTTANQCNGAIKLYIDDVTATGAIDDGKMLLEAPNRSLRHDKEKKWRDLPTELFRQAMLDACVSEHWKAKVIPVTSAAQADLSITVHLRAFHVQGDGDDEPTEATAAAIVQFAPARGEPFTKELSQTVLNGSQSSTNNLYSVMMSQAVSTLVDEILDGACKVNGNGNSTPAAVPKVATIPAWDSLFQRDVGVVVTLGPSKAGTISIRNRFGAPIWEWKIKGWNLDSATAMFDIEHPWTIQSAAMEIVEVDSTKDSAKKQSTTTGTQKKQVLLRFKKIPGVQEFEVREMTRGDVAEELGKFK
ncbi:MAG: membrane integrity-associated transporter subunit PqiC [Armatimonadetes bacterium]|nr:membrane integrity-associated transporter subunit PqiC [Armatimonadota bacterium]